MGLALLLGGLSHREANVQPAKALPNAFLVMILPLTVLGLVLPNYTRKTPEALRSTYQMVYFLSIAPVRS